MTVEELTAEADRLAAARADARTPAIVRRAWLRPGALTLRRFLALEEAASPVLSGLWPLEDAGAFAEAFSVAWGILFPERPLPAAADVAAGIGEMLEEVQRGFSTVMSMRFPRYGRERETESHAVDGLGWAVRLVASLPWPPATVLDMPLDEVFMLVAGRAAVEGAECAGQDYRERLAFSEPMDHDAQHDQGEESAPEENQESEERDQDLGDAGRNGRNGGAGQPHGMTPTEPPQDDGREDERGGGGNGDAPSQGGHGIAVPELPAARDEEVDGRTQEHGGRIA